MTQPSCWIPNWGRGGWRAIRVFSVLYGGREFLGFVVLVPVFGKKIGFIVALDVCMCSYFSNGDVMAY